MRYREEARERHKEKAKMPKVSNMAHFVRFAKRLSIKLLTISKFSARKILYKI